MAYQPIDPSQATNQALFGQNTYPEAQTLGPTPMSFGAPGQTMFQGLQSVDTREGLPKTRAWMENLILANSQPTYDGENNIINQGNPELVQEAQRLLGIMDQHGVNDLTQIPPEKLEGFAPTFLYPPGQSLGQQAVSLVTSGPALVALAGGAGVFGAGAAGAGGSADLGAFNAVGAPVANAGLGTAAGATGAGVAGGFGYTAAETAAGQVAAQNAGGTSLTQGSLGGEAGPGGVGGAGGVPTSSGLGGTGTAAASGTALSRILGGTATDDDYLQLTGQIAPSLLGLYASNKQTDALQGLAAQYASYGAPYREQLATISQDPSQFYNSPGAQQAMKSFNQSITPGTGNPAGSPYAQTLGIESLYKQYGAERDRLAGFGGLTQYNSAVPGLQTGAIGSQANAYNAVGAGIGNVLNPQPSLMDIFKNYNSNRPV